MSALKSMGRSTRYLLVKTRHGTPRHCRGTKIEIRRRILPVGDVGSSSLFLSHIASKGERRTPAFSVFDDVVSFC